MEPETAVAEIPFNRVSPAGDELELMAAAVEAGSLSGNGEMAAHCERLLESITGGRRVMLTPSCTQALEIAALLLDLEPGDEIICPSFTFPSTASAFALHGARPAFCEIREDTLNLDERRAEELVGPRTRAIVATHYAGVACEMDALSAICERHGIDLIEDAAHALFGSYMGTPLGGIGRFGALSFHETKNVTCGEGGALILREEADAARAEVIREKGTNRSAFFRGEVSSYSWVERGSSYLPSELQAAFLRGQLDGREAIQASRHRIWDRYAAELAPWAEQHGARLPQVPVDRRHPAHLFHLLLPGRRERDALIAHLRSNGILAVFHYLPLHLSPMGRRLAPDCPPLPVTEATSDRIVRLPLFATLTEGEQTRVIEAVTEFAP